MTDGALMAGLAAGTWPHTRWLPHTLWLPNLNYSNGSLEPMGEERRGRKCEPVTRVKKKLEFMTGSNPVRNLQVLGTCGVSTVGVAFFLGVPRLRMPTASSKF
jgi:hypothetical protein